MPERRPPVFTGDLGSKRGTLPGFASLFAVPTLASRCFTYPLRVAMNITTGWSIELFNLNVTAALVLYSLYLDCGNMTDNQRAAPRITVNGSGLVPWHLFGNYGACPIGETETDPFQLQLLLKAGDNFNMRVDASPVTDSPNILVLGILRGWFL